MFSDIRLAARTLARSPGYSLLIILTLALGIGANTAIFSFFRGVLLRPLPYADPERTVIFKKSPADFAEPVGVEMGLFAADFEELRRQSRTLDDIATYTLDTATLTGRGPAELLVAAIVTPNYFSVLGAQAQIGRTFTAGESSDQSGRLAVLSHAFWQTRFGGDPAVIGEPVIVNNVAFTVVGVAPADVDFPREAQVWVTPAASVPEDAVGHPGRDFSGRGNYLRTLIGRLSTGSTIEQSRQEIATLVAALPNPNAVQRSLHLMTLRDQAVGSVRPALAVLLACVGMVLLLACFNVANLMLSRATTRERELSIRLALGACRWRITRQLLGESLVLALSGGAAGVMLSLWTLEVLVSLAGNDIPRLHAVEVDGTVLAFAFLISVGTGIACGLAPVLGTARVDLMSAIKSGDRGGSPSTASRRMRSLLVAGEVAISLVLLVAAGLLLRSLERMRSFDWGIDAKRVVTARVAFLDPVYSSDESRIAVHRRFLDELRTIPEFEAVGTSLDRIGRSWIHMPFRPEGHTFPNPADRPQSNLHIVSSGYLASIGATFLDGRPFTEHDDTAISHPVAIVDAALVRRYFPDGRAIGRRLWLPGPQGDYESEIVGVVSTIRSDGPGAEARPDIYVPFSQIPLNTFFVHARTPLDARAAGAAITRAVRKVDAGVPVAELASMEDLVARPANARRFRAGLLSGFAAGALVLAAVGIYAVTGYSVTQRQREIGVRMAVGADARSVLRLVIRQAFKPIAAGLAFGLAGAIVIALGMRRLLFDVAPLDLTTFLGVSALLAGVALLACVIPARRATRVEPLTVLRAD